MAFHRTRTLLLFFTLTNCGEPKLTSDHVDLSKSEKILIINDDEDFTVLTNLYSNIEISKHVPMSPNPARDQSPCKAPNEVEIFDDKLYITCSTSHEIQVYDLKTLKFNRAIKLKDNPNPMGLIIVDDSLAFTNGYLSNNIISLDLKNTESPLVKTLRLDHFSLNSETQTFPRPSGLTKFEKTGYATLANLDEYSVSGGPGYLVSFDLESKEILKIFESTGKNPTKLYKDPHKKILYMLNTGTYNTDPAVLNYTGDGFLDRFDMESEKFLEPLKVSNSPGLMAFSKTDNMAYVNNMATGSIQSFNTKTLIPGKNFDLGKIRCEKGKAHPYDFISSILVDGNLLLVTKFNTNCLIILDRNSGKLLGTYTTGKRPQLMIPLPD